MPSRRVDALGASLIAVLASVPALAQQDAPEAQRGQAAQATAQGSSTLPRHGHSDGSTMAQGPSAEDRLEKAEVEHPERTAYERGFRRGYAAGLADGRDHLAAEMQRHHAPHARSTAQYGRKAAPGGWVAVPGSQWIPGSDWFPGSEWIPGSRWVPGSGWMPLHARIPGSEWVPGSDWFPGSQWFPGSSWVPGSDEAGQQERGSVIVLPPGMSAEDFAQRVIGVTDSTGSGD